MRGWEKNKRFANKMWIKKKKTIINKVKKVISNEKLLKIFNRGEILPNINECH